MTTPLEPIEEPTAAKARPASMGELFATLSSQITTLINGEIELNKLKAKNFVKKIGVGGVLLAVAAVFAFYLLGWVFHASPAPKPRYTIIIPTGFDKCRIFANFDSVNITIWKGTIIENRHIT